MRGFVHALKRLEDIVSWKGDRRMTDQQESIDLRTLLDGLKLDAEGYFAKTEEDLDGIEFGEYSHSFRYLSDVERLSARDQYWTALTEELRNEAKRLYNRLVSLMGQVVCNVRNAPLASEADQRDVMIGTKTMRAVLLLRRFRSWNTEIMNDEDVVLGVIPAGQSDTEPLGPTEARQVFAGWAECHQPPGIASLRANAATTTTRHSPTNAPPAPRPPPND